MILKRLFLFLAAIILLPGCRGNESDNPPAPKDSGVTIQQAADTSPGIKPHDTVKSSANDFPPIRDTSTIYCTLYSDDEKAYDVAPSFKPENGSLADYMKARLVYPDSLKEKHIKGIVKIQVTIDENGYVTGASIRKKLHPVLDNECLEVVKNMPPWTPAVKDGKPIAATIFLPVTFTY